MTARFVTLPEILRTAKEKPPREVWNFGDGGDEAETTLRPQEMLSEESLHPTGPSWEGSLSLKRRDPVDWGSPRRGTAR